MVLRYEGATEWDVCKVWMCQRSAKVEIMDAPWCQRNFGKQAGRPLIMVLE